MSLDGFKKQMGRTTTSILQKAGAVDKTIDKELDEQERKFKALELKTTTMYKEGKNYLDALRAMNLAQLRIAEAVTNFYDETATLGLCGLKYRDAMTSIDTDIKGITDTNFRNTVLEPIGRYNAILPDIHEAIKKRNNKLLDYDSLRDKVKSLTQKPSDDATKLPRAEQQMVAAKEAYDTSNQQLKDEIPRLIEARVIYFDPSFEALVKTQLDYYARCYETLLPLQKFFGADNGVDLNGRMQDSLQKMRDLAIVKAVPPPAPSKRMSFLPGKE